MCSKSVENWIKKYDWKGAKQRYLQSLPDVQGGLMPTEDLAKMQENWFREQVKIADEQIALARADLQLETEEKMSATGVVQEMKRSAASKRLDQQRLFDAMDRMSIALRMPHKMTGAFAGASVDARSVSTTYNVNFPKGFEPSPTPALPDGAPAAEVIEAEVQET